MSTPVDRPCYGPAVDDPPQRATLLDAGRLPRPAALLAGVLTAWAAAAGCAAPTAPAAAGPGTAASPSPSPSTSVSASTLADPMGTASPPAGTSPAHPASPPGAGAQAAQPPTAGPSATGPNPAACQLLTPAEINTVTGLRVGNGKPDVGAGL